MKEQYYGEYFARAIMFTNEIDKTLEELKDILPKINIKMADLLEIMNETFLNYASNGFVTDKAKSNIYSFLHFVSRMQLDEETRQVYYLYRETIMDMLNGNKKDNRIEDFYRQELFVRKNKKEYFNRVQVPTAKIEELIPSINDSIVFDSKILFSHLEEDGASFRKQSIKYVSALHYVESARFLIYEYPCLIQEDNFKNRLCFILEQRFKLNREYRRNIFKRFSLDKENKHIGAISYGQDTKKLYKQVVGL